MVLRLLFAAFVLLVMPLASAAEQGTSDASTSKSISLLETFALLAGDKDFEDAGLREKGLFSLLVYEHLSVPNLEIIESDFEELPSLPPGWLDNRVAVRLRPVEPERRHISIEKHEKKLAEIERIIEATWNVDVLAFPRSNALVAIQKKDDHRIASPMDRIVDPGDLKEKMTFEDVRTLLREKHGMEDFAHSMRDNPNYRGYFLCQACSDTVVWIGGDEQEVRVRDLALALLGAAAKEKGKSDFARLIVRSDGTWSFGR